MGGVLYCCYAHTTNILTHTHTKKKKHTHTQNTHMHKHILKCITNIFVSGLWVNIFVKAKLVNFCHPQPSPSYSYPQYASLPTHTRACCSLNPRTLPLTGFGAVKLWNPGRHRIENANFRQCESMCDLVPSARVSSIPSSVKYLACGWGLPVR